MVSEVLNENYHTFKTVCKLGIRKFLHAKRSSFFFAFSKPLAEAFDIHVW